MLNGTARETADMLTRRSFVVAVSGACLAGLSAALVGCASSASSASVSAASAASVESGEGSSGSSNPSGTKAGEVPASARDYEQISTTLFVFDTVVTLVACCSEDVLARAAERCNYFEQKFSRTIETSDIGRINAAKGQPVQVAPETADIIAKALGYCRDSDGAFDITIGAASSLWDFKEGVVPDPAVLAEAVTHIDYRLVDVEGDTVTLRDPQAKLDLGGIAKGYIADDLASFFIAEGCDSAYVNLGGNVKTIGVRPDGKQWHVGIQDPNDAEGKVIAAVYSQDTSIVTSGLYERRFSKEGREYWHILDPKTGYPAETDLVSATIVSDASIDGDGLTKPLFMMGRDAALAWMNARDGVEGLVVGIDGAILQTDGCQAEVM